MFYGALKKKGTVYKYDKVLPLFTLKVKQIPRKNQSICIAALTHSLLLLPLLARLSPPPPRSSWPAMIAPNLVWVHLHNEDYSWHAASGPVRLHPAEERFCVADPIVPAKCQPPSELTRVPPLSHHQPETVRDKWTECTIIRFSPSNVPCRANWCALSNNSLISIRFVWRRNYIYSC